VAAWRSIHSFIRVDAASTPSSDVAFFRTIALASAITAPSRARALKK
jgi:hypothetical protein